MMKLPHPHISFFCLCMLLSSSCASIIIISPVSAEKPCDFPAIFNLGDSNSDSGGLAAAFTPPNSPYGETYFHMPAGRFSDGRLIIDFIAQSFDLPYISAYLNSLGTNFSHGANFATAASTIRLPTRIIPGGGFSPFYLDVQLQQFSQFKNRSQIIRNRGGIFASLMPREEYFSKALYTFDIGQNDLGAGFFGNMSVEEVNESIPDIINKFSANVKNIYNLGARSFWIHNTGPIGCLPYILANFPSAKDFAGCAKPYNEVAQNFNLKLKEAVVQLRKDFPSAAFTYVDVYSVKYSLFRNPKRYGFELPTVACCGYGDNEYNYSGTAECGQLATVNGTQFIVGSCDRPSVRVNWDGIHYTEAAAKFVFDRISTGAFSDPRIPLKMACRRALID
ncbi:GDSL esterase/lipase [Citrus sinensis]|uniref:esterase-like n=1 Tax=Citrus sinensis TaxID=2711 RepID=UPI00218D9FA9|nr:esterase-like [Citrus sinensis]KAH9691179.1 GDSL esterase/lipase [Citrus sinensis]